ncbi:hypothetical protein [Streptomyces europaeiscabiei]|uniref:hypothetical protein n=1 Tax=Streptomyces europaeiscabiei TaxID=146819 RepID=UPI002E19F3BF
MPDQGDHEFPQSRVPAGVEGGHDGVDELLLDRRCSGDTSRWTVPWAPALADPGLT